MRQVLFTIPIFGGLKVFGYGAMLVVAFVTSTWLAARRASRERLDPEVIWDIALWIFLCGMLGARLFYCVEYWGTPQMKSVWDAFQYWKGGIVFYGGIIGGSIAFFVYRHFRPFPLRPYMDALAPSIALGTFFGRLGCFLNGCCYGDPCQLPFGVSFPAESPPWVHQVKLGMIPESAAYSLPVHPTQIYSAIDALVLLFLLTAYYPLRRRDGAVIGLLMVTYPVTRFLVEFLRNDEAAVFGGLTISQNISVVLLLSALVYWVWLSRLPQERYGDQAAATNRQSARAGQSAVAV
jgi:phosphatidylglycerol:prolipoprotein diacylglycerol transferase